MAQGFRIRAVAGPEAGEDLSEELAQAAEVRQARALTEPGEVGRNRGGSMFSRARSAPMPDSTADVVTAPEHAATRWATVRSSIMRVNHSGELPRASTTRSTHSVRPESVRTSIPLIPSVPPRPVPPRPPTASTLLLRRTEATRPRM